MEAEASYPYENIDYKCRSNVSKNVVTVTGFTKVATKDENALQQAVATIGPIAVAIDSNHPAFQLYKSGSMYFLFKFLFVTKIQVNFFSLSSIILLRKKS